MDYPKVDAMEGMKDRRSWDSLVAEILSVFFFVLTTGIKVKK